MALMLTFTAAYFHNKIAAIIQICNISNLDKSSAVQNLFVCWCREWQNAGKVLWTACIRVHIYTASAAPASDKGQFNWC